MSASRSARHRMSFLSLVLVFLFILSTAAQADFFGFEAITDNGNTAIGAQLSVDVTDYGNGQVLFTFNNAVGPYVGVITEVFFEDGPLFGLVHVINSPPDVVFVQWDPGDVSNLPRSLSE